MTLRKLWLTKDRGFYSIQIKTNNAIPFMSQNSWYTYILECSDNSFYVGITNDLKLRLVEHNAGHGALWARLRRPVKFVYAEQHPDKSQARKREIKIKGWRREKKIALCLSDINILKRVK